MSITRMSIADAHAGSFSFSAEEKAFLDRVTDEELQAAAKADPDNPPWTSRMFESARRDRSRRSGEEVLPELRLALQSNATDVWVVTDEEGRTTLLRAAKVERAESDTTGPLYEIVPAMSAES